MKPDQLSDSDAKRLASIRLDDVLEQLPEGTQAHVSGMPSIQKTYTDITLEDMATFVPLISQPIQVGDNRWLHAKTGGELID